MEGFRLNPQLFVRVRLTCYTVKSIKRDLMAGCAEIHRLGIVPEAEKISDSREADDFLGLAL
jgi:hypothetical protein